ncbi:RusA family crossover junction endodeoxyribonuclease [Methylobacterium brachythecii]|uniref:Holliday junction resolvase RusA-like endonuclease n=1 Tax=Methylobacterium brachythecii TaxID=1176177 RepID=A0A7W6F8B1_9HYPH|nr:RusA family crossover junction endodeoxyribonuclease [Methylobacterium brachythecii]MBB3904220.1 Holliday junction resolvase RusA-like endonuclease [Methylobacterium brachythecii]GLS45117.1 hypothetical protein GCM10007884_31060 [Methylobacterium brachythecii]
MEAPSLSPTAKRRAKRTEALHKRPEQRPVYAQRSIVPKVEIRFPLPPSTNSLFANVAGRGRIKTPKYRAWRQQAVLQISIAVPRPGRIAGVCDVEIFMPPFTGDTDNRIKPCLDAAVEAGIIAGDDQRFVRKVSAHPGTESTSIRMVLTAIPVKEQDAAEIELRHRDGWTAKAIADANPDITIGQVETVIAGLRR